VKPRPIKSMAALRRGVWAGKREEGGANSKWVRARPVNKHGTYVTDTEIREISLMTGRSWASEI